MTAHPLGWERPEDWVEKVWLEQLREFASTLGWMVYHPHRSKRSETGFPDLTLVRERVVFAELKRQDKAAQLRPDQELWRDRLLKAGAEWYLWRPLDVEDVMRVLGRRQTQHRPRTFEYVDPEVARERLLRMALGKGRP